MEFIDMNSYTTSDIVLASFLRLHNVPMLEIVKAGNKGTFVFGKTAADVATLTEQFDLGQAVVEPVSFNNMIKQLTTAVRRL